jgi:hypothetical protein
MLPRLLHLHPEILGSLLKVHLVTDEAAALIMPDARQAGVRLLRRQKWMHESAESQKRRDRDGLDFFVRIERTSTPNLDGLLLETESAESRLGKRAQCANNSAAEGWRLLDDVERLGCCRGGEEGG